MSKVVVTGLGQDGYYLSKQLLDDGYEVIGLTQYQSKGYRKELKELMKHKKFTLVEGDICERTLIRSILKEHKPKFFFNTAAMSHVGVSFKIPEKVMDINCLAVLRMLEEIKENSPDTSFLQCSTSEMFGDNPYIPQNEDSHMNPQSPYAIAKTAAYHIVKLYRKYGLKTYNTICFNHESEIRPETFVTRKISKTLAQMKKGKNVTLELGNMKARRDWGYAPEYCDAMIKIIKSSKPDDYVVATNETHSIKDFVREACNVLGLRLKWIGTGVNEYAHINGRKRIVINKKFYRPAEVNQLKGDPYKIRKALGWEPKIKFKELVEIMVRHDLKNE